MTNLTQQQEIKQKATETKQETLTMYDFLGRFKSLGTGKGTCPTCKRKSTEPFDVYRYEPTNQVLCDLCYHKAYNNFKETIKKQEPKQEPKEKRCPFSLQQIKDLTLKRQEYILHENNPVGCIYDDFVYITDRNKNSFMIKYQGYGFSLDVIDTLKYRGINHIIIRYTGSRGTSYYYLTLQDLIKSNINHYNEKTGDRQKFLRLRDLEVIEDEKSTSVSYEPTTLEIIQHNEPDVISVDSFGGKELKVEEMFV